MDHFEQSLLANETHHHDVVSLSITVFDDDIKSFLIVNNTNRVRLYTCKQEK